MTVLRYPLATEKAIGTISKRNTITYIVDFRASKKDILKEIEEKFGVKVASVKTANLPNNTKKAFITLAKGSNASDVAMKLKLV
jgi:large subunit ribosomal protein L23